MKHQLIVIKVGTSSLTAKDGSISSDKIKNIADQISVLHQEGYPIVLVTSGSIAAGFRRLGYQNRPVAVAAKQAAAAVGQGLLMEEYTKYFSEHQIVSAQLLLTRGDFTDKRRYQNAFNAMQVLLEKGAVPIINENDTIAIEELKLGDNDTLSAQVAAMLHAELLILLTDVDGLYTANPATHPDATLIRRVEQISDELNEIAGGAGSANGTGGMLTKLKGATLATSAGVNVFICSHKRPDAILHACDGNGIGTLFCAKQSNMKTKLQWMAFYAHSTGNLYIDEGAKEAITVKEKSLLPAGIFAMEGDFHKGDVVNVYLRGTHEYLGKGIINYSKDELTTILSIGGGHKFQEAIHRDNWVGA